MLGACTEPNTLNKQTLTMMLFWCRDYNYHKYNIPGKQAHSVVEIKLTINIIFLENEHIQGLNCSSNRSTWSVISDFHFVSNNGPP